MSLQIRMLGAILALLVLALVCGTTILIHDSQTIVRSEVDTAFQGAVQSVRDTLQSDVEHTVTLRQVVASFHGQRQVRAALVNEHGKVVVASHLGQVADPAPLWFRDLMTPPAQTVSIPIALRRFRCVVILASDPSNEIAKVWSHARDMFVAMLVFFLTVMAAAMAAIAYISNFLNRLQAGLMRVSSGDYEARLDPKGPPEFVRLVDGFNHMAGKLSSLSRNNRQLNVQLQNVQEEERAGIARDLHDEVGPYLFNLAVDAKAIGQLNAQGAEGLGRSVREAVAHIQAQVRNMLRQLRPVSQLEFGLELAIRDQIAFWSRRFPGVQFDFEPTADWPLTRSQEEAAFRIVQESVSNAVRHGTPSCIQIRLYGDGRDLELSVEDDGGGIPGTQSASSLGQAGVTGMRERALALNGHLDVEETKRGVCVRARLPGMVQDAAA